MNKIKYFVKYIILCIIFNYAIAGNSLYAAKVAVSDRSDSEWHKGVAEALKAVLVKVSGNAGINTLPKVNEQATEDNEIVEQFSYGDIDGNLYLNVSFDLERVNNILTSSGQLIWGGDRASTLVWFVNDKGGNTIFITDQDRNSKIFKDVATQWGIEVYLPLNDLAYSELLQMDINTPSFNALLRKLSTKYGVDQVLFGEKDPQNSNLFYWKLIANDSEYSWSYEGKDFDDSVRSALGHLVQDMVARSAVYLESSLESNIRFGVNNVTCLESYQHLVNFLKSSPVVSKFSVSKVEKDVVIFDLSAKGGALALGDFLQRNESIITSDNDPDSYSDLDMVYKWIDKKK